MKVWGINERAVIAIVRAVSHNNYEGNLVFKRSPEKDGRGIYFTLTVVKASEPGGVRSANGRKVCAACWHCHRDVMRTIFALNPHARIKTGMVDYRDVQDFEDSYRATGFEVKGLGDRTQPLYYHDACECVE